MHKIALITVPLITAAIQGLPQVAVEAENFPSPTIRQEMVLVPGGSFIIGRTRDPGPGYVDDASHRVRVDSFLMDKYEVTNSQYYRFCNEAGHPLPEFWAENPTGPPIGKRRVIRGGGWRSGRSCNACWFRQSLRPFWVDMNVGFRCARSISR